MWRQRLQPQYESADIDRLMAAIFVHIENSELDHARSFCQCHLLVEGLPTQISRSFRRQAKAPLKMRLAHGLQEIGLASLGASEEDLKRLATVSGAPRPRL